MPTAIKRRKLSTTTAKKVVSTQRLDAFTRVSKATSSGKITCDKKEYVNIISVATDEYISSEKKRKLSDGSDDEDCTATILPPISITRTIKPPSQRQLNLSNSLPETPNRPLLNPIATPTETSTKGATSLLNELFLSSKTPKPSPLSFKSSGTDIKAASAFSQWLPTELLDLINLHASFLTALSLHYAHNGTHSPADLRLLCPDVARAWGKRKVTLEDIRRTLGTLNTAIPIDSKDPKLSRLTLSDYGHGKICIEIKTGSGRASMIARPINENALNEIFIRGLKGAWEGRVRDVDVKRFIANLPMEGITTCSSLTKMSPLLAKGQRRLEEMRAGITVKETAKVLVVEPSNGTGAKLTLLERLRAKQLQQANMPPPLSKAELARKAALQRIEEVVAVFSILSTSSSVGQQRISFTLPTVLGKLRDSFKTPMSKEEGDTCVRLLASEIAPEWVKMVKMGKVEAIVFNRDERPGEKDIKERVRRAS
ncbi:hypothetical protein B7494_g681 [Chlorociboria aeruginascens]|nr:hypothetical protein B7494_g681 [Chlorociboria aeruginascens]